MILLRSIIFFILMPVSFIATGIVCLPLFLTFNSRIISLMVLLWGYIVIFLLKIICKVDHRIIGEENMLNEHAIIASRHQSTWETAFLMIYLDRPAFILKRELLWLPVFGWYLVPSGMISVNRGGGIKAIKQIVRRAKEVIKNNHIVIFPEGTRLTYGQVGKIQSGILAIHNAMPDVPIIPISLNSGKFWNKKSWIILPGTVCMQINKPIYPSGMSKEDLIQRIEEGIVDRDY